MFYSLLWYVYFDIYNMIFKSDPTFLKFKLNFLSFLFIENQYLNSDGKKCGLSAVSEKRKNIGEECAKLLLQVTKGNQSNYWFTPYPYKV